MDTERMRELRPIDQLAFKCHDADLKVQALRALGANDWITDTVEGVHLYKSFGNSPDQFGVKLAFNRDLCVPRSHTQAINDKTNIITNAAVYEPFASNMAAPTNAPSPPPM